MADDKDECLACHRNGTEPFVSLCIYCNEWRRKVDGWKALCGFLILVIIGQILDRLIRA